MKEIVLIVAAVIIVLVAGFIFVSYKIGKETSRYRTCETGQNHRS